VEAPALRRYSLGGLGAVMTTIGPRGDDLVISAVAPSGDVDGDRREDLLVRGTPDYRTGAAEEVVALVYGYTGARQTIDPFQDGIRKTLIRIPATRLNRPTALGGGDLDGDGLDDIFVAAGPEPEGEASALLVIFGVALCRRRSAPGCRCGGPGCTIIDTRPPDRRRSSAVSRSCPLT